MQTFSWDWRSKEQAWKSLCVLEKIWVFLCWCFIFWFRVNSKQGNKPPKQLSKEPVSTCAALPWGTHASSLPFFSAIIDKKHSCSSDFEEKIQLQEFFCAVCFHAASWSSCLHSLPPAKHVWQLWPFLNTSPETCSAHPIPRVTCSSTNPPTTHPFGEIWEATGGKMKPWHHHVLKVLRSHKTPQCFAFYLLKVSRPSTIGSKEDYYGAISTVSVNSDFYVYIHINLCFIYILIHTHIRKDTQIVCQRQGQIMGLYSMLKCFFLTPKKQTAKFSIVK